MTQRRLITQLDHKQNSRRHYTGETSYKTAGAAVNQLMETNIQRERNRQSHNTPRRNYTWMKWKKKIEERRPKLQGWNRIDARHAKTHQPLRNAITTNDSKRYTQHYVTQCNSTQKKNSTSKIRTTAKRDSCKNKTQRNKTKVNYNWLTTQWEKTKSVRIDTTTQCDPCIKRTKAKQQKLVNKSAQKDAMWLNLYNPTRQAEDKQLHTKPKTV